MRLSFEKIVKNDAAGVPALATSRGDFLRRESLLVKLARSDADADAAEDFACGECAPCGAEFGCETLAQAEKFLRGNEGFFEGASALPSVPAELPCVAHAVSAAAFFLENPRERERPAPPASACAKLIRRSRESSVDALLAEISSARAAGFPVCKIKIGFGGRAEAGSELAFCREILSRVKSGVKIRFDANGAFPPEVLPTLVALAERFPALDFFEQPFPPTPENDARLFALPREELQAKFALDESVLRARAFLLPSGCPFPQGATRVVSVVKPLLAGDFCRLLAWLEKPREACGGGDVVISTVFENTAAGRAALFLACAWLHPSRSRAFGLG